MTPSMTEMNCNTTGVKERIDNYIKIKQVFFITTLVGYHRHFV